MKKNSKRYREILKTSIKDKKVVVKEALELVKRTQLLNSMSQLMCLKN